MSNLQADVPRTISSAGLPSLAETYQQVRQISVQLAAPLEIEDYVLQSMPDVSPTKWHLAHVSWFFETFILLEFSKDYQAFNPAWDHLFNSYYQHHGQPFFRPQRGLLSRPTVNEVYQYREYIDQAMQHLLCHQLPLFEQKIQDEIIRRCKIGLNHEQQHQELLLTDIKYNLYQNPLLPAYSNHRPVDVNHTDIKAMQWQDFSAGLYQTGCNKNDDFYYDNELPLHQQYLDSFQIASRTVTNQEYLQFINDGGYQKFEFWLSDGWDWVRQQSAAAPLYWQLKDDGWHTYTLHGLQPLQLAAPVVHLNFYEADAYARWADARLPTEAEWEVASQHCIANSSTPQAGVWLDDHYLQPQPLSGDNLQGMMGSVWEWTSSAYLPYPGYRSEAGALGEYNGKFMCNQMVLRGGSCVSQRNHLRPSYRNFFYPHSQWQFSGIRLAR